MDIHKNQLLQRNVAPVIDTVNQCIRVCTGQMAEMRTLLDSLYIKVVKQTHIHACMEKPAMTIVWKPKIKEFHVLRKVGHRQHTTYTPLSYARSVYIHVQIHFTHVHTLTKVKFF